MCIRDSDTADAEVIRAMADNGVKLLALRCAGYNNVDLAATAGKMKVVRAVSYTHLRRMPVVSASANAFATPSSTAKAK